MSVNFNLTGHSSHTEESIQIASQLLGRLVVLRDRIVAEADATIARWRPFITQDEGIKLLTGRPAGSRGAHGRFQGTINRATPPLRSSGAGERN